MKNDLISIIIISKNDKGLSDTLASLTNKIIKPTDVEIIVVDASSGKLNYLKNNFKNIKWLSFTHQIKQKITIPHQRNFGVKNARGNIIVFTDASCIPTKKWLQYLYERYKGGEVIVSGQIKPSEADVINNISPRNKPRQVYVEECPTANVLISKKVIDAVGPFDENFEYGSDTDFMWRARDMGFKIYFEPKALLTHNWGNTKQQLRRSFDYGRGRMRLYLKHTDRVSQIATRDPILVFYPPFLLFLPVAIIYPYYLLLLLIPLIKNRNEKPVNTLFLNTIYGVGALSMIISYLKLRITTFLN